MRFCERAAVLPQADKEVNQRSATSAGAGKRVSPGGTRPRCLCRWGCWIRGSSRWSGSNRPSNCCAPHKDVKMSRQLRRAVRQKFKERKPRGDIAIMSTITSSEAAKAIIRQNTEEVQGRGNFDVFDELFADDFIDHTPQPGTTPDKAGVRKLYTYLRVAFPDFHADIHWQLADGDRVTTYKTYRGTHQGPFLGVAPTHRKIHFETVDVMRVQNGKITDHWGVANL